MRKAFVETVFKLAEHDDRVVMLTGDLGYALLEPFRDRFPKRFFNVGVAEQNMISVATGLAEAGFLPYAYSIATFAALRPFEFIRNGPVLHRLPVRIAGAGAGFGYGHAGVSHYAIEDVAALRTLAGLTIVVPADNRQTVAAVEATASLGGPVYFSLAKDDTPPVPGLDARFALGRVQQIRAGSDLALVTMGAITAEVVDAASRLAASGLSAAIFVVSNFHPDPDSDLAAVLPNFRLVVGVEAQTASGGLCSLLANVIASRPLATTLLPLAVNEPQDGTSGSQQNRWKKYGIDAVSIVAATLRRWEHLEP